MSDLPRFQRELSPAEATLDAPGSADTPSVEPSAEPHAARIAVIEGSGPQLTQEIQELLRRRLRLATIVLAAGFAVFLLLRLFDQY